jgi:hypothetical protein
MFLPVRWWFLHVCTFALALSRIAVCEPASAQMKCLSSPVVLSIGDGNDLVLSAELPDAPTAELKRITTPPFDANRLLLFSGANNEGMTDHVEISLVYTAFYTLQARRDSSGAPENSITLGGVSYPERYHWAGLIAQSFFFHSVEATFRIASDDQIRYLVAKKPFWHDYFASLKQFNMRRWNDGDNFLVNYVGHPMQGSISAFIEIQNSPTDRTLELSATDEYWMSRFKGFLWATVYSTYSEISPLGEAGIGNAGGWTYPIANCHRPCPNWDAKAMHYTNNTGWVDFIITPTVGMLWVLAEDTLDRYVSDRIQGTDQSHILPKIIRGSLNPSRSFANAMRLKLPWYRDFQHGELAKRYRPGIHMLRADDESTKRQQLPAFSFAAHYRSIPLGTSTKSCVFCNHGSGFEADYAISPWLSISIGLDRQQGLSSKSSNADGTAVLAGFGVRLVHDRPHNTFMFAIRPGFVLDTVRTPAHVDSASGNYIATKNYGIQHTAATLLFANDYKITRNFAVRSSIGATVVRYPSARTDPAYVGKAPYLNWLSPSNYANRTTWIWQTGPVIRF